MFEFMMSDVVMYTWLTVWLSVIIFAMIIGSAEAIWLWISAFILAWFTYFTWSETFSLLQFILLAILTFVFSFLLPYFINSKQDNIKVWLDKYIWKKVVLEDISWKLEVKLDWVNYPVSKSLLIENNLKSWDNIKIKWFDWNEVLF